MPQTERKAIRARVGPPGLARQLGKVAQACRALCDQGGEQAPVEMAKAKPNLEGPVAPGGEAAKEAHGAFESEHPGYCLAQDSFCVRRPEGGRRISRQTAIDTHAKPGFARRRDPARRAPCRARPSSPLAGSRLAASRASSSIAPQHASAAQARRPALRSAPRHRAPLRRDRR